MKIQLFSINPDLKETYKKCEIMSFLTQWVCFGKQNFL